jgi:uncharacterized protein (TIGR03083 family)
MTDAAAWAAAVRSAHDRFAALTSALTEDQVRARSYATDWSNAQVASHLGSQAEIYQLYLDAGLAGTSLPEFQPIWDRWNALDPEEQVRESNVANETFVSRVEALTADERDQFATELFGSQADLSRLLATRLAEHTVHSWDVAVIQDPRAALAPDSVKLLIDHVAETVAWIKPTPDAEPISIVTTDPDRSYLLTLSPAVRLEPSDEGDDSLRLPAEALIRLIYGRLDPDHAGDVPEDARLDVLRAAFPGF